MGTKLHDLNIAIVGGGISGLASALYLHRAGHRITLFEKFKSPQPLGSGLLLQPTGLSVLAELGLYDQICALGNPIYRLVGNDARSGRMVLAVDYRTGHADRFGLAVHRAAIFDVLYKAVLKEGIEIQTDVEVKIARSSNIGICLETREEVSLGGEYDFVVDAGGSQSPLRDPNQPSNISKELAYGAYWATLDWCEQGFDIGALQQRYHRASVMIGILPIGCQNEAGPQKTAFFWSLKPRDAVAVESEGIDAWKRTVLEYWPQTKPYLDQITGFDDLTLARYGHHTMRQPFAERLVHVGDSAHSTSPQLGQGANMALLDAHALAFALSRSYSVEEAFRTYAQIRRWHVRLFQFLSKMLTPFYQSDSRTIPFLRDTLVSTVAKVPAVSRVLTSMVAGTLIDPFGQTGLSVVRPRNGGDG